MKIVDINEYRNEDRKLNEDHDMIRITMDMTKKEYYELLLNMKWEGVKRI